MASYETLWCEPTPFQGFRECSSGRLPPSQSQSDTDVAFQKLYVLVRDCSCLAIRGCPDNPIVFKQLGSRKATLKDEDYRDLLPIYGTKVVDTRAHVSPSCPSDREAVSSTRLGFRPLLSNSLVALGREQKTRSSGCRSK